MPEGTTLQIQQVGICLDRPATGQGAWGEVRPLLYDETAETFIAADLLQDAIFPPGYVDAHGWCFFDLFATVPEGHELEAALDNPGEQRARMRILIRGWLVPAT